MGLTTSGSVPLALPGGEAQDSKKAGPAPDPLLMRTPAKADVAFSPHKKKQQPAFWKQSKRAFGKK